MNKGFSKIELTTILAVLIVVTTTAFIFGTTRNNKRSENMPTPTQEQNQTLLPTNEPAPVITTSPKPTALPSATPSPKPVASGIKGLATLKSCSYGSCSTVPVSQMKIDIKTTTGTTVTTVYTDSSGYYSANLDPGSYVVGPFQDTITSAKVNEATVKINKGYFTKINVKFESTQ